MISSEISPAKPVDSIIHQRIQELDQIPDDIRHDLPFVVADVNQLLKQHQRWLQCIPKIVPFYAVKCNPDVKLLKYMAKLGVGFDCASLGEMQLVYDLGIDPSRIIFAHPCHAVSALQFAAKHGVMRTTFDNIDELDKIKKHAPNMKLLLRIYAEDDTALACLGNKFGAPLDTTWALLQRARELELEVEGISFHIGSGASKPTAFVTAVQNARRVWKQAEMLGFTMSILDVGGGFQNSNFEIMALTLRHAIEKEFPDTIQLIAEPGRFYARPFYTIMCKVISRRRQIIKCTQTAESDMLYLNDGIYGSFMNALTEGETYNPSVVVAPTEYGTDREPGQHAYSVWGPTCDGLDCVAKHLTLECEVKPGDWLKFSDMGAYSLATSTQFNGFPNYYHVAYVAEHTPNGHGKLVGVCREQGCPEAANAEVVV